MKKKIIFMTLISLGVSFWGCHGDCSGWVTPAIYIGIYNTKTQQQEDMSSFNSITVKVGDDIWKADYCSSSSCSLRSFGLQSRANFPKEGKFTGIIEIDNTEVCRIEYKLVAAWGCNGYPENGTVSLISGEASLFHTTLGGGTLAELIIKR